jgi:hypothetical protein
VLDDAFEIAAMIIAAPGTIEETARDGGVVVSGIAVGKAVGHDEVQDVVGGEALEAAAGSERRDDGEGRIDGAGGGGELQGIAAGASARGNLEIEKKVRAGGADREVGGVKRGVDRSARKAGAADEHPESDGMGLDGPIGRLHPGHGRRGGGGEAE